MYVYIVYLYTDKCINCIYKNYLIPRLFLIRVWNQIQILTENWNSPLSSESK